MNGMFRGATVGSLLALCALAPSAGAQLAAGSGAPTLDGTMGAAHIGARAPTDLRYETSELDALQQRRGGLGRPIALMGVGAAGLLAGALIGDDAGTVIMIAGGVIFLYGLYTWAVTR